jgi:hypothetical protein
LTEAVVFVCPNPKCRREIEEPILLTILSVTPPKKYEACPYCLSKLEQAPDEQEIAPEPVVAEPEEAMEETAPSPHANAVLEKVKLSAPQLLKRVKSLIPNSNGSQKEQVEKTEAPQAKPSTKEEKLTKEEEPETETLVIYEAPKETPKSEQSSEKESKSSGCPQTFGYLASRPADAPIPQECLLCPRIVDCMLNNKE